MYDERDYYIVVATHTLYWTLLTQLSYWLSISTNSDWLQLLEGRENQQLDHLINLHTRNYLTGE